MGYNSNVTSRKLGAHLTSELFRKLPSLAILIIGALFVNIYIINITLNSRKKTTGEGNHRYSARKPRVRTQAEPVDCSYMRHRLFPLCMDKLKYLQGDWNKWKCFYDYHKVNGSQCSLYNYFTNIEPYCLGRKSTYININHSFAKMRYDLNGFLQLLPGKKFLWMKKRATFMWPSWVSGAKKFSLLGLKYKTKKVVVYMKGIILTGYLDCADKGCPLGELIQWTDLIASLYILGYDVAVVNGFPDKVSVADGLPDVLPLLKKGEDKTNCAVGRYNDMIDVIYMDIIGLRDFLAGIGGASSAKYRCALRILDSFGTFAEYNFPAYPHKVPNRRSVYTNWNLILTQFLTLYPHTADNSFLGFVIPNITKRFTNTSKNDMALLYAKDSVYITLSNSTRRYLDIVSEYFKVHATSSTGKHLPPYVHNHGSVSGEKVQELLSKSKLFIGVGFPYEGPGPIEAMANGAVYIQPKFDVPKNKLNDPFWAAKPTLRKLYSQNPYMEEFVGEPFSYTINVTDEVLLRKTLQKIKERKKFPAKIPKEFTNEGMLKREHAFTQKMDYCNPYTPRWPPLANMQVYFSISGQSCKDACMSRGLVCERTYFDEINTVSDIENYSTMKCNATKYELFLHAPSMDALTKVCYLQAHDQVFSCMHNEEGMARLCPCRDYEIEQSAICGNCL